MKKLALFGGCLLAVVCAVTLGLHSNATAQGCMINIHNIQKSFDPTNCSVTVTWDTDHSTNTNYVDWGATCTSLVNQANGTGGKNHSATFDITGYQGSGKKIAIQITSSAPCGSETSSCQPVTVNDCIQSP